MEDPVTANDSGQAEDDQSTAKSDNEPLSNENKKPLQSNSACLQITDLPADIIHLILRKLKFGTIAKLRQVSKYFNEVCSFLLDTEFNYLRTTIFQRFQSIKALMPRRESARRKHHLARESDITETMHMRLSLLHMTFGKYIEKKYCCFFPGDIIDEIHRILLYMKHSTNLNRAYKVTDELFDLSTMALEYFKECIEPTLPEICFFTTSFFENSAFLDPSTIHSSELLDCECSSVIEGILSTKHFTKSKDPLVEFQEQLNTINEIASQSKMDILQIKRSLKTTKNRVTAIEKELHEIKWLQKNYNSGLFPEYSCIKSLAFGVKEENIRPSCSSKSSHELKSFDIVVVKSKVSCRDSKIKAIKDAEAALNTLMGKLPEITKTCQNTAAKDLLKNSHICPAGKRTAADCMDGNLSSQQLKKKKE